MDTLIPVTHPAVHELFPGHVKGMRTGCHGDFLYIGRNDTGADQNRHSSRKRGRLPAIRPAVLSRTYQLPDQLSPLHAASLLPGGQNRIDSQLRRLLQRCKGILADIKRTVQRDSAAACCPGQTTHLHLIQRTIRIQTSNDNTVRSRLCEMTDITEHLLIFILRVQKIPESRADQNPNRKSRFLLHLFKQLVSRRCSADDKIRAQLQPGCPSGLCG